MRVFSQSSAKSLAIITLLLSCWGNEAARVKFRKLALPASLKNQEVEIEQEIALCESYSHALRPNDNSQGCWSGCSVPCSDNTIAEADRADWILSPMPTRVKVCQTSAKKPGTRVLCVPTHVPGHGKSTSSEIDNMLRATLIYQPQPQPEEHAVQFPSAPTAGTVAAHTFLGGQPASPAGTTGVSFQGDAQPMMPYKRNSAQRSTQTFIALLLLGAWFLH